MKKDRVILFHPGPFSPSFDVFRRRGSDWQPDIDLYEYSECKYVHRFLEANPDFEYLGSEDLAHEDPNLAFLKRVLKVVRQDDVAVVFDSLAWEWPREYNEEI